MHRLLLATLVAVSLNLGTLIAQVDTAPSTDTEHAPSQNDSTDARTVDETVDGLVERTTLLEQAVDKLKAIKISGYVQSEWQHFDQSTNQAGGALYSDARKNLFTIRRGRLKVQHKLGDVMSYTIQPDITEAGVSIKDAFLSLNFFTNDELRLDAGMFNRPNFEVELSSSAREATERSQVVRAFYPGERDLGLMLTSRLALAKAFGPRLQLGIFNGPGTRTEIDAVKDVIGRITFPLPLGGESPLQVDLGASFYYGGIPQTGDSIHTWEDGARMTVANAESGGTAGWGNNRNAGVEGQIYLDLLPFGGTIIRGEFLTGQRASAGSAATAASVGITRTADGRDSVRVVAGSPATPLAIRHQTGYYAYLVQNLGTDLQFVARFDAFDRNTDVSGTEVTSTSETASSVIGLGLNYHWERFRVTLYYEMPSFAADESIQIDPSTKKPIESRRNDDVKDNKTTLRLQYRF